MSGEQRTITHYDRVRADLANLTARFTRPRTVRTAPTPLSMDPTTTYMIESCRLDDPEDGARVTTFVEIAGPDGLLRVVLPDKVGAAISDQRASLFDRSTRSSRTAAKRTRDLRRRRSIDHKDGKHAPAVRAGKGLPAKIRGCPLCK